MNEGVLGLWLVSLCSLVSQNNPTRGDNGQAAGNKQWSNIHKDFIKTDLESIILW